MRLSYVGYQVEPSPAQRGMSTVYRPIVPIRIVGRAASVRIRGLLDSGADETLLTQEMADTIGAAPIPGAAGRILSAGGEVAVAYATIHLELTVDDETFNWPAVVGVAHESWDEALLGFRGFLEYFDVALCGHALEFHVVRNTRPFAD